MWNKLLGFLVGPLVALLKGWIELGVAALAQYFKEQAKLREIKKEAKETLNDIKKEKDPAVRARRLRDYLS